MQLHSSSATASCLKRYGSAVTISREDADYIALDAGGGGYLVELGSARLNMAFERTENDARRTEKGYEAFALGTPTSDVLFRKANVVMAWDDAPTDSERRLVEDCLSTTEGG